MPLVGPGLPSGSLDLGSVDDVAESKQVEELRGHEGDPQTLEHGLEHRDAQGQDRKALVIRRSDGVLPMEDALGRDVEDPGELVAGGKGDRVRRIVDVEELDRRIESDRLGTGSRASRAASGARSPGPASCWRRRIATFRWGSRRATSRA